MQADREIALYTLEGVQDARVSTHYLTTEDKLGLSMLRFTRGEPTGDAVLVIHGLTTSTDMFVMPEHENLVSYLLGHGFNDVWCLDFRMSNRHSYNLMHHRYTMDDVALYDFPPAIAEIHSHVPDARIHVICHCLGSVSFTMSLFGGVVDGITSVISNSVSLTPRLPRWSQTKLTVAPFVIERVVGFPYVSPRWADEPFLSRGKLTSRLVSMGHRECDVPACHMLSFMWGSGKPALYHHKNLADVTHRRGGDLYGATSVHYYRHVAKMVKAGRAVKYDPGNPRHATLPDDYLSRAREVKTPVMFVTGERNDVFRNSNVVAYEQLRRLGCSQHELNVIEGYGHQDVFMGREVARDVFPSFLDFLERKRAESPEVDSRMRESGVRTLSMEVGAVPQPAPAG